MLCEVLKPPMKTHSEQENEALDIALIGRHGSLFSIWVPVTVANSEALIYFQHLKRNSMLP